MGAERGGELTLLLLCELLVDLYVFVCAFVGECVVGLVEELAHCASGRAGGSCQFLAGRSGGGATDPRRDYSLNAGAVPRRARKQVASESGSVWPLARRRRSTRPPASTSADAKAGPARLIELTQASYTGGTWIQRARRGECTQPSVRPSSSSQSRTGGSSSLGPLSLLRHGPG